MADWKKMLLATTVALPLVAAPAFAAEVGEWDQDNDGALNEQELRSGFESSGLFEDWDTDDDGVLSENEFDSGLGDGGDAFNQRFGDTAFTDWDEDGDGSLAEDEFYGGVYAGYDDDGDDVIEEPELSDLGDDMGDAGFWDV